jgi:O-antigen/teichoic acid export membrane protein
VVASASQSLMPAASREGNLEDKGRFQTASRLLFFFGGWSTAVQLAITPFVALLVFGRPSQDFFLYTIILGLGAWINSLGLVGYYTEFGAGRMTAILKINIAMVVITLSTGWILGSLLGGPGIALGWTLALGFGGIAVHVLTYREIWSLSPNAAWRNPACSPSTLLVVLGLVAASTFAWTGASWSAILSPSALLSAIVAILAGIVDLVLIVRTIRSRRTA